MQEQKSKKQIPTQSITKPKRSSGPIHLIESSQLATVGAQALQDVHLNLVRAQQNIARLIQGNYAPQASGNWTTPSAGPFASNLGAHASAPYASSAAPFAGTTPAFATSAPQAFANWASAQSPLNGAIPAVPGQPWGPTAQTQGLPPMSAFSANPYAATQNPYTPTTPGSHAFQTLDPATQALQLAYAQQAAAIAQQQAAIMQQQTAGFRGRVPGQVQRVPAVDVVDEGSEFVLQVELPGVRADQVEMYCYENSVVVSAVNETEVDIAGLVQAERGAHVLFQRAIPLPAEIQPSACNATLRDGILTVTLPKLTPTEGPRLVPVKA